DDGSRGGRVCVVRDKDTPRGRRGPERPVVRLVAGEPRRRAARAVRAVDGPGQVTGLVRALRASERLVVAAARLGAGDRELLTVRLVEGDVRRRLLRHRGVPGAEGPRPPDVLPAREDRVRTGGRIRISRLRPVER